MYIRDTDEEFVYEFSFALTCAIEQQTMLEKILLEQKCLFSNQPIKIGNNIFVEIIGQEQSLENFKNKWNAALHPKIKELSLWKKIFNKLIK